MKAAKAALAGCRGAEAEMQAATLAQLKVALARQKPNPQETDARTPTASRRS